MAKYQNIKAIDIEKVIKNLKGKIVELEWKKIVQELESDEIRQYVVVDIYDDNDIYKDTIVITKEEYLKSSGQGKCASFDNKETAEQLAKEINLNIR